MCDYSLAGISNRLAVESEELVIHRFHTGSIGLASPCTSVPRWWSAKQTPAVEQAVQQAMSRARAYKIDYLPDGSVAVKVSLLHATVFEGDRTLCH